MDGVLVIDKPAGPTSFDVVRQVRALLKVKKAGHTGTLDPMATGVLPSAWARRPRSPASSPRATRPTTPSCAWAWRRTPRTPQGKVIGRGAGAPADRRAARGGARAASAGTFEQVPPMYSAVKVGGKRLYELARAGEEVERASRQVTVLRADAARLLRQPAARSRCAAPRASSSARWPMTSAARWAAARTWRRCGAPRAGPSPWPRRCRWRSWPRMAQDRALAARAAGPLRRADAICPLCGSAPRTAVRVPTACRWRPLRAGPHPRARAGRRAARRGRSGEGTAELPAGARLNGNPAELSTSPWCVAPPLPERLRWPAP